MQFAIEESDRTAGYKKVHVAGCRDLEDPENFTSEPTLEALFEATEGYDVALDIDELKAYLAPCAAKAIKA